MRLLALLALGAGILGMSASIFATLSLLATQVLLLVSLLVLAWGFLVLVDRADAPKEKPPEKPPRE